MAVQEHDQTSSDGHDYAQGQRGVSSTQAYSALQMKLQSVILLSICSVQIVAFLGKPVVTNGHSMVTVLVLCTRLTMSACIAETQSK